MITSIDNRYTVESVTGNEVNDCWKILDHVDCVEDYLERPRSMGLSEIEAADFYFDDAYLLFRL